MIFIAPSPCSPLGSALSALTPHRRYDAEYFSKSPSNDLKFVVGELKSTRNFMGMSRSGITSAGCRKALKAIYELYMDARVRRAALANAASASTAIN